MNLGRYKPVQLAYLRERNPGRIADVARLIGTPDDRGLVRIDTHGDLWRELHGQPPLPPHSQSRASPAPRTTSDPLQRLSQPQIAERLAICRSCEHYRDRDRDGNLAASCGKIIDTLGKRGQLMHEDGLPNPNARCPDHPRRWDRMTPKLDKVE